MWSVLDRQRVNCLNFDVSSELKGMEARENPRKGTKSESKVENLEVDGTSEGEQGESKFDSLRKQTIYQQNSRSTF